MDITDLARVKIKLEASGMMPERKSSQAAGFDLYCPQDTPVYFGRQIVDLKFKLEMPPYIKADIRPRSGYSAKGFEVVYRKDGFKEKRLISADVLYGTIDADYRGNVGVILKVDYTQTEKNDIFGCYIPRGERIAQLVFSYVPNILLLRTESLDMSVDRGGGFGHTNNK